MSADLHKQLEALHGELSRTDSIDSESRELLIALLTDITRLLESQPVASDATLADRLEETAVRFEAEHPTLGTAIRRLVDTLGKAGI